MRGVDPVYACQIAQGCRSIETVAKLRPDLDAEAENRIVEDMEMEDTDGVTVLPGVLKLLAALPQANWTVVTSATEPLARVRLAAGGIPVPKRIITAECVSQGKPDPAPYLAGAALLGFAPEECVVFEDAASEPRLPAPLAARSWRPHSPIPSSRCRRPLSHSRLDGGRDRKAFPAKTVWC